ncbi:hypothetical protein niasHT_015348 [Heterodera trifolii]|uniref:Uncharacterized protein n=1 Tax=Heterodera trifolii TaxID=157864 RepID=A0ABD2KZT5_9BILA
MPDLNDDGRDGDRRTQRSIGKRWTDRAQPPFASRYGSHSYGSGTYGTNYWSSSYGNSRTQPSYGYGGQQSRYGTHEQNGGENGQFERQNAWRGGGGQWGLNQQNWGQPQQQGATAAVEGGWGRRQQQQFPSPAPPQTENNWDNSASFAPSTPQNRGKLRVDLPPGAPGTMEAADADQSSK